MTRSTFYITRPNINYAGIILFSQLNTRWNYSIPWNQEGVVLFHRVSQRNNILVKLLRFTECWIDSPSESLRFHTITYVTPQVFSFHICTCILWTWASFIHSQAYITWNMSLKHCNVSLCFMCVVPLWNEKCATLKCNMCHSL